MHAFCIDSEVLGTSKHLLWDGGVKLCDTVPSNVWHLSGKQKQLNDWCLDTLLKVSGQEINLLPPEPYVNVMKACNASSFPWSKTMPLSAYTRHSERLLSNIIQTLPKLDTDYFYTVWRPGSVLLRSLQRTHVDLEAIEHWLDVEPMHSHVIETFMPEDDGLAKSTVYDRLSTVTGRLVVRGGPSILTLKRGARNIIAPSDGGNIVMVDFSALEARVLLYENDGDCGSGDLYASIASELGYDRKAVKAAVISKLYGSSRETLGRLLGIGGGELAEFTKKFDTYFDTSGLLSRVKSGFYRNGFIRNKYGRRISIEEPVDNVFISYYGQSTGVDVTLLGYKKIVDQLRETAPGVRPLFLLHDAIFLDVPNEHLQQVLSLEKVDVPGYKQSFRLAAQKIERYSRIV